MGHEIAQLGIQKGMETAQDIVNTGMGLLLEGHNDRRQLRQQQKLTDIQFKSNAAMAEHNKRLQMEIWKETNYGPQMEELRKAGLNPGLLYGMSGGGAVTTGSPGGSGVSGGQAPQGGQEIMGIMMQKSLMEAQIRNIEADTANKQADTANKPLMGKNIEASTANLTQGVENAKAQENLTKIQTILGEIETNYKGMIMENENAKLAGEVVELWNNNEITNATKQDKINQIKAEAVNAILTGQAIKQGIELNKAQINKMMQDIIQRGQEINIEKFKAEIEANFKGIDRIAGNLIEQMFRKIDTATGQNNDQRPIKIK